MSRSRNIHGCSNAVGWFTLVLNINGPHAVVAHRRKWDFPSMTIHFLNSVNFPTLQYHENIGYLSIITLIYLTGVVSASTNKWSHPALYDGSNYLFMLRLNLNHISERGNWSVTFQYYGYDNHAYWLPDKISHSIYTYKLVGRALQDTNKRKLRHYLQHHQT